MEKSYNILHKDNPLTANAFTHNSSCMLPVVDWMVNIPPTALDPKWVQVQFKNTHKAFYKNSNNLPIQKGDTVVVESTPGYDVGEVVLTSPLISLQMKKDNFNPQNITPLSVLRIATKTDIENAQKAHEREIPTLIRARQIASSMELEMKIGNVEFQGDGKKAIFYYIAEHRIDFRQLIKFFIENFHVRIEMRQIGVRQEAGGIGGIGPCGRELCCSTWKTSYTTISAAAAKKQNLSLNPQKLAGLCAKLKCCITYELPIYEEAIKKFPPQNIHLETSEGTYYYYAMEPLADKIIYSADNSIPKDLITFTSQQANEIIAANKKGITYQLNQTKTSPDSINYTLMTHDDVNRFDEKNKKNKRHPKSKKNGSENTRMRNSSNN